MGCVTVVIACFPFVFGQMLPMLTYAGLLVVPVGAIVFAEHVIFPRIGFTRYWARYRRLTHSTPAVASWIAGLVFGFGLNAMNVMSFFYLFLPTWAFTIILYTILAKRYGAGEKYPLEEEEERKLNATIKEFQAQQAITEGHPIGDQSALTKVLQGVAWTSLGLTLVLALMTMFWSPDMVTYEANAAIFYTWGFVFTITYFVSAYCVLRRKKALNLHLAD